MPCWIDTWSSQHPADDLSPHARDGASNHDENAATGCSTASLPAPYQERSGTIRRNPWLWLRRTTNRASPRHSIAPTEGGCEVLQWTESIGPPSAMTTLRPLSRTPSTRAPPWSAWRGRCTLDPDKRW